MAKATSNTYVNLAKEANQISDGNESIVIVNALGDIPGGRTLDLTGFTDGIRAGHVIIESSGVYKPLALSGSSYDSKDGADNWVGIARYSVKPSDPRCAIVTVGQVNAAACPYPITDTIAAGLPRIEFLYFDANS